MELTIGSAAGESNNCGCIQIIDGHGTFNVDSCQKFQTDVNLAGYELSYALISIIGPQTSGKSTLLNEVFGTTFVQLEKWAERPKCTHGIWLERADITERCILVMDLEGTDGKEKQDNTTFEKQSAVFGFLISDVVLINMWFHDIGHHRAANRPLYDTVFQAVLRLSSRRKTTLIFVIRDTDDIKHSCEKSREADKYSKFSEEDWKAKQKAELKIMEDRLKEDIRQIWDSFSKPEAHKRTPFSAFYNIEVVFLSHRGVHGPFKNELTRLRQEFHHSIVPGVLAGDREDVFDGSSFSCNAQLLWEKIKENKDLDLPEHKIMVATVRCEQIAKEKFESFVASKEWLQLCQAVRTRTISNFGKELSEMIKNYLSSYDEEATYLDRDVKLEKRKQLEEKLVQHVHPTYQDMLLRIMSESLENFKEEFEEALHVGGEKFIVVARNCADYSITQFKEKFRDARIDHANRDESVEVLGELQRTMAYHILKVSEQMHRKHGGQDRKDFNKMLKKGREAVQDLISGMQIAIFGVPEDSGLDLKATIANQLVRGVGAIGSVVGVGAIGSAVGVGAIGQTVGAAAVAGVVTGVAVGIFGVGVGVAVAVAAEDEKRKMNEVADYIVELLNVPSSVCEENQWNAELLEGLFISGENQLDVEHLEGPSSECGGNQLDVELLEGSNSKCEEK